MMHKRDCHPKKQYTHSSYKVCVCVNILRKTNFLHNNSRSDVNIFLSLILLDRTRYGRYISTIKNKKITRLTSRQKQIFV